VISPPSLAIDGELVFPALPPPERLRVKLARRLARADSSPPRQVVGALMDIEAVRSTLEQASLASLAVSLAIGFLFSFNPVALAAIPKDVHGCIVCSGPAWPH
jgi:hypothetical protein